MVAVYGEDSSGLRIKPWLGPAYGGSGYAYLSRTNFGLVFVEALGFDPIAMRWLSLVRSALSYPLAIPKLLPIVIASTKMK